MKVFFPLASLSMALTAAFQPISLHSCGGAVGSRCGSGSVKSKHREYTRHTRPFAPLYSIFTDIESLATKAADTWGIESTLFMEPDIASQIEEQFQDRGDVIAFRVVGGRRRSLPVGSDDASPGEGRRSRFVLMHPDLGLDLATAESEYCTVIRVDNVNVAGSNTFPNALASIGVHLENVGDIVVEDSSTVYLVVDPTVAKQCLRLLSKELMGAGINLSVCEDNEFMPDGEMQEMKLSRILERQMERKKLEQGFVQFG
eukprot:CAMPEP_0172325222 /NCGR_PEP_ID=MMETSP1058-20130122/53439_1 /TAXON_ID=83371 /ORGANISM="Detonula confervacea, Strain CCMP 353" /LENGTH=257 /DNA_ID=CAMNT_0013041703 /DNA_START=162 /DNA_END=935 /DNA_ORIENTATION=+